MGKFLDEALASYRSPRRGARIGAEISTSGTTGISAPTDNIDRSGTTTFTAPTQTTPDIEAATALLDNLPTDSSVNSLVMAFQKAYNAAHVNATITEDGRWGTETQTALALYGYAASPTGGATPQAPGPTTGQGPSAGLSNLPAATPAAPRVGGPVQTAANAVITALPVPRVSPIVTQFQEAYNAAGLLAANGKPLVVDGQLGGPGSNTSQALAPYRPPFGSMGPAAPGQFLPSVLAAFVPFTVPLEGRLNYFYQDEHKPPYVTTGIGNLVNTPDSAWAAGQVTGTNGWRLGSKNGPPATQDQVIAAWNAVNSNTDTDLHSGRATGIPGNNVFLTDAAVDGLVLFKLRQMIATVTNLFPNVLTWPADAQLGLTGVIWGTGPNLTSPAASYMSDFVQAIRGNDFDAAAQSAHWGNITADRKAQLNLLFSNASDVVKKGLDRTVLNWPSRITVGEVLRGAAIGVAGYTALSVGIFMGLGTLAGIVGWYYSRKT